MEKGLHNSGSFGRGSISGLPGGVALFVGLWGTMCQTIILGHKCYIVPFSGLQ